MEATLAGLRKEATNNQAAAELASAGHNSRRSVLTERIKEGIKVRNTRTILISDLKSAKIVPVPGSEAVTYTGEDKITYIIYNPSEATIWRLRQSKIRVRPCYQVIVGTTRVLAEGACASCKKYLDNSKVDYAKRNRGRLEKIIENLFISARKITIYSGKEALIHSLLNLATEFAGWFDDPGYLKLVEEAAAEISGSIRFGETVLSFMRHSAAA